MKVEERGGLRGPVNRIVEIGNTLWRYEMEHILHCIQHKNICNSHSNYYRKIPLGHKFQDGHQLWPKSIHDTKLTDMPLLPNLAKINLFYSFMCLYNKLGCQQWNLGYMAPRTHFQNVGHKNQRKAKNRYFQSSASSCHGVAIYTHLDIFLVN